MRFYLNESECLLYGQEFTERIVSAGMYAWVENNLMLGRFDREETISSSLYTRD